MRGDVAFACMRRIGRAIDLAPVYCFASLGLCRPPGRWLNGSLNYRLPGGLCLSRLPLTPGSRPGLPSFVRLRRTFPTSPKIGWAVGGWIKRPGNGWGVSGVVVLVSGRGPSYLAIFSHSADFPDVVEDWIGLSKVGWAVGGWMGGRGLDKAAG